MKMYAPALATTFLARILSCSRLQTSVANANEGRSSSRGAVLSTYPSSSSLRLGWSTAHLKSKLRPITWHARDSRRSTAISVSLPTPTSPDRPPRVTPSMSSAVHITPDNSEIVKKKRRVFTDCYELGEEIGKGGFGVVHLAILKETGEKFAVKIVKITNKNHRSVLNEVRVHAKMKDTDLVARLQDVFYSRENLYLVMERCTGGDIMQAMKALPADTSPAYKEQMVAHFVRSALHALVKMHNHNICHRDVKPQNFLLLYEGAGAPVKVIDFGVSTMMDPRKKDKKKLFHREPLKGTPHFVPPEAFKGVIGPAGDMWSLGVMAYLLLTGRNPFEDPELCAAGLPQDPHNNPACMDTMMKAILTDEITLRGPEWETLSHSARHFVLKLLERDPSKRPTAKEALRHAWPCPYNWDMLLEDMPNAADAALMADTDKFFGFKNFGVEAGNADAATMAGTDKFFGFKNSGVEASNLPRLWVDSAQEGETLEGQEGETARYI